MRKDEYAALIALADDADRCLNETKAEIATNEEICDALIWDIKRVAGGQPANAIAEILGRAGMGR